MKACSECKAKLHRPTISRPQPPPRICCSVSYTFILVPIDFLQNMHCVSVYFTLFLRRLKMIMSVVGVLTFLNAFCHRGHILSTENNCLRQQYSLPTRLHLYLKLYFMAKHCLQNNYGNIFHLDTGRWKNASSCIKFCIQPLTYMCAATFFLPFIHFVMSCLKCVYGLAI